MIVENLQRPKWFRRLETLKGSVLKAGTYGIMQVRSDDPLTDEESVGKAVAERLKGLHVRELAYDYEDGSSQSYPDSDHVKEIAMAYNPSEAFAALVVDAFTTLYYADRKERGSTS
jgi:hypothetical protein